MVLSHHVQPQRVCDEQPRQQRLALQGVILNGFLLLRRGLFPLLCELVLQRGHADVHGQRSAHQAVSLGGWKLQLLGEDVAQRCAHQGV